MEQKRQIQKLVFTNEILISIGNSFSIYKAVDITNKEVILKVKFQRKNIYIDD